MSSFGDVSSRDTSPTDPGYESTLSSTLRRISYDSGGKIQLLHLPRRVKQRHKKFILGI